MAGKRPVFKPYDQTQLLAIPPTLEELIPKGHPVRVVNEVINKLNIEPLLKAYHIKGSSSYHPQLLLKVLVYGYVTNIYSSRKLAAACKESVYLMWLSSMSYPDHNTINRFRGVRLKHALRSVFEDVVKLLSEEGLLSIDEVNTDGTKIEASANKYTFVWKKSIQTNKEKMKKQLTEIWQYAQQVAADEDQMPEPPDFTEIDSEKVKATVEKLNEKLAGRDDIDKKVKTKLNYITKHSGDLSPVCFTPVCECRTFSIPLAVSLMLPILFIDGHHWCLIGTLPNQGGCIGLRSKSLLLFDALKIARNAVNLILPLWIRMVVSMRSIVLKMLWIFYFRLSDAVMHLPGFHPPFSSGQI
jgi:transposase